MDEILDPLEHELALLRAVREAAERYVVSVQQGMPQLVGKGARSLEFAAKADQTAAAWTDLKAALARASGAAAVPPDLCPVCGQAQPCGCHEPRDGGL